MSDLKKYFQQFLIALAMFASGAAAAGPVYHVSVDTTPYSGEAMMDLTFLANLTATPATAVLNHFSGAFGAEFDRSLSGVLGAIPGQVQLDNQNGGSYLTQRITLGGVLGFDIHFDGNFATAANLNISLFNATLYNSDFTAYVGVEGSFSSFALMPPANGQPGGVLASPSNTLATVGPAAAVPEPSVLLLALSALALMGLARLRAA